MKKPILILSPDQARILKARLEEEIRRNRAKEADKAQLEAEKE
jgi:hypothetical protein